MPETGAPANTTTSQEADILSALGARSVVLVGMMGAGKSTIGRRLSARLRLPFLDADTEIEAAAGMSIPDIFETHGEPHFRDGEARVIARLLDGGPAIIATGGGAFMREETRNRIAAKAVSIWLKADADIIMKRVKRRADRPLLQTADPAATVGRLRPCNLLDWKFVTLSHNVIRGAAGAAILNAEVLAMLGKLDWKNWKPVAANVQASSA